MSPKGFACYWAAISTRGVDPMPLISMCQLLDHAAEHGYGLPAFNVNNMEQIRAIMEAAAATDSPVILQGSVGARKYAGDIFLRHRLPSDCRGERRSGRYCRS